MGNHKEALELLPRRLVLQQLVRRHRSVEGYRRHHSELLPQGRLHPSAAPLLLLLHHSEVAAEWVAASVAQRHRPLEAVHRLLSAEARRSRNTADEMLLSMLLECK